MDKKKRGVEQVLYRCMAMRPEEKLLIVTDSETESLGDLFYDVAVSEGIKVDSVSYRALALDGMEPPREIADALLDCDVAILVTSRSLTHTKARHNASDKGVRIASLPGFTEEMLEAPMMVDYDEMTSLSQKMAERLTKAEEARIVTSIGTDLSMCLKGREGQDDCGIYARPGDFGNLPAGEAYIAPLEGKSEGTIVYDGSMSGVGLLNEVICVDVVGGEGLKVRGGEEARKLDRLLDKAGRSGRNIAELGIGTNKGASLTGSVLEDEKVFGTIHIALGDNANFGGKVEAPCHLDGILKSPDLYLDGEQVMKKGKWLI